MYGREDPGAVIGDQDRVVMCGLAGQVVTGRLQCMEDRYKLVDIVQEQVVEGKIFASSCQGDLVLVNESQGVLTGPASCEGEDDGGGGEGGVT